MLYEMWLEVARERGREIALWECGSGRRWRFSELRDRAECEAVEPGSWVFPQGHSSDFLLATLRAWRAGAVVCPLEREQSRPVFPHPPQACCHLKTTSATSGRARAIAFTAEQLTADVRNIVATMGLRAEWPNLGAISLAHSYGFSNLVLPLFLHGIPLILAQSPLPEMVKAAAAGHENMTLAGVPALWRGWSEAGAIPDSVRLAISAGAPLRLELEQSIYDQRGLKIHNFYGSSECGGIAFDPSPIPRNDEACVGQAMRDVNLSVAESGCLEVRGDAVGECYWPESEPALGDGRFCTSDLAEIKNGEVSLRGRVGDQINVAGRKVAPETIEATLRLHAGVKDCLVFGIPEATGERSECIVASVVTMRPIDEKQLKLFLQEHLPAWQVPREWWLVPSLSANARGKISRTDWARRYLEIRRQRSA